MWNQRLTMMRSSVTEPLKAELVPERLRAAPDGLNGSREEFGWVQDVRAESSPSCSSENGRNSCSLIMNTWCHMYTDTHSHILNPSSLFLTEEPPPPVLDWLCWAACRLRNLKLQPIKLFCLLLLQRPFSSLCRLLSHNNTDTTHYNMKARLE